MTRAIPSIPWTTVERWKQREPDLDARLLELIECWDPRRRPRHCSNCRWARVGHGEIVRCAHGHGQPLHLGRMLRERFPRGFRAAGACPDFETTADEPSNRRETRPAQHNQISETRESTSI